MITMTDAEITTRATQYMGKPAWETVCLAIAAVTIYVGVFYLSVTDRLPLFASFIFLSYLAYVTYTPLHEAVHNNIAGPNRRLHWLNDLIGYLTASIQGLSFKLHKSGHMAHHRHTNVKGADPDMVYTGRRGYDLLTGGPRLIFNEHLHYFAKVFPKASQQEKLIVVAETLLFVGWRVALAFWFPLEVLVLGVLANIAGVTILGCIFAWIVHVPFNESARYKDTATILLPRVIHRPVTMLWLWQNYHSIHHLFPRVPFFRYAELFDEIRPGMVEREALIVELGGARN